MCIVQTGKMCIVQTATATATATASASATATATATHPSMKEAALRAASTQGGGGLRRPPPCVDSFMDGCVAVAVAVAEAESVAVAVAICTIHIFPVCTIHIFQIFTVDNASLFGVGRGHFFGHFSICFGLFRTCSRSVPMRFGHRRKVFPRGSRGVSGHFFPHFFRTCSGRSPGIFPALPDSF